MQLHIRLSELISNQFFCGKFEKFLIGFSTKIQSLLLLKIDFNLDFRKMGDFLIQKHCGASLKKVKLTSFFTSAILLLPSFSLRRL